MSTKEAHRKRIDARLAEWRAEIDRLEAKAQVAKADARAEYEKRIQSLKAQHEQASHKLDEMRRASGEAWRELAAGLDRVTDELGDAVKRAASKFGK